MDLIEQIIAREILDSRGNPTVEVELQTQKCIARVSVPSGASTGVHEALELRDGDPKRYMGKGVLKAVANINTTIRNEFVHQDLSMMDQADADKKLLQLDGTENKSKLGANAILGVSLAFAKAKAYSSNMTLYRYFKSLLLDTPVLEPGKWLLPVPQMNIINGGKHTDLGLDFQEFMILPVGAENFREAVRAGSEIFHTLKSMLQKQGFNTTVGDEGGFAPAVKDNEEALKIIMQAIEQAGYTPGKDIFLGLDVAASSFYDNATSMYSVHVNGQKVQMSSAQLHNLYLQLLQKYPLLSIEDPFAEDDWPAFQTFTAAVGKKTQVVGDDLFVTNPKRIAQGIQQKSANSALIKLNQIGTVTETIKAVEMSMQAGWTTVISHRSGETEDTTIADLAVGLSTGQIKTGSLSRTERTAKYNQLMRTEEKEKNTVYAGPKAFYSLK